MNVPDIANSVAQPAIHRIREARRIEGVSIKTAGRRLGINRQQVLAEENPNTDLTVSRLHEWAAALQVPVADLISECDGLSLGTHQRQAIIRAARQCKLLLNRATPNSPTDRIGNNILAALIEAMPEVVDVSADLVGRGSRPGYDLGKAATPVAYRGGPADDLEPLDFVG